MMADMLKQAKQRSLTGLQQAMDDDDAQPLLTIKILAHGDGAGEPDGDEEEHGPDGVQDPESGGDMPDAGDPSELGAGDEDPFMELLKKKLAEKAGR